MKKLATLIVAAIFSAFAGNFVADAGEYQSAPYKGSKEFERMKQLVGAWEGTSNMEKEGKKVRVEYRLTAGGSALVETLFPGTDEEMISVYHDRKGKLAMTHYCMFHNQPRMSLRKTDAKTIQLGFAKLNDIDPLKETHMHALSITFTDHDHIIQKWTMYEKGQAKEVVTFNLTRVR